MSSTIAQLAPLPGLDVVGRGVYLNPRRPYELKGLIFPQANARKHSSPETGGSYQLPQDYDVNQSPPMPTGISLNRIVVEESTERLNKQLSFEAAASCGKGTFNVDASSSSSSQMQRNENAYYATRTSFLPFWTVYLSDLSALSQDYFDIDIPTPFSHAHRKQYSKFFNKFGSHYVKRAWVGGKATLIMSVLKSDNISESQIREGLKASFAGVGKVDVNSSMKQSQNSLSNNSDCEVSGSGGDSMRLAKLSSLDEQNYNDWVSSIKDNPQSIELDVAGIWLLIEDDEKADTLMRAYKELTVFEPISAMFSVGEYLYITKGHYYSSFNTNTKKYEHEKSLHDKWSGLEACGFNRIDSALSCLQFGVPSDSPFHNKLVFFRRNKYITMDVTTEKFSKPKRISEGFPGVPFSRIDAALLLDADTIYLFSGEQYVRFDVQQNKVADGYPLPTKERWSGVSFDKIDSAIYWGNGKVYFFREDQYISYDITNYRADSGYPKQLLSNYVQDWGLFV